MRMGETGGIERKDNELVMSSLRSQCASAAITYCTNGVMLPDDLKHV